MNKTKKNYCQKCCHETNHNILSKESYRSNEDEGYDYQLDYMIVKCNGCDTISFRKELNDIENAYPDEFGNWQTDIKVTTYPSKNKVTKKIKKIYNLPNKISSIYLEAINAYNADCPILTGVAFRTVIEAICIEENIIGRDLEKKINNLVRQKLITEKEAKRLHSIRFIGNDSVHEMKIPSEKSLEIVLNIIEHLLNNIYLIDRESKGVLETVIDEFPEFEKILNECVEKINGGEEIPLAKILGKNVRRFIGKLNEFETELIKQINTNKYTNLSMGKVDVYGNDTNQRQHFIINNH